MDGLKKGSHSYDFKFVLILRILSILCGINMVNVCSVGLWEFMRLFTLAEFPLKVLQDILIVLTSHCPSVGSLLCIVAI